MTMRSILRATCPDGPPLSARALSRGLGTLLVALTAACSPVTDSSRGVSPDAPSATEGLLGAGVGVTGAQLSDNPSYRAALAASGGP